MVWMDKNTAQSHATMAGGFPIEMVPAPPAPTASAPPRVPQQVFTTPNYVGHKFVEEMKHRKRFFHYRVTPSVRPGKKWDKVALLPEKFTEDDMLYGEEAVRRLPATSHCLGIYFYPEDEYVFNDLDGCRKPDTDEYSAIAHKILPRFQADGAYMEQSISGEGVHAVGRRQGERPVHGCKNRAENIELYSGGRGMAIGTPFAGTGSPNADCTTTFQWLIAEYFVSTLSSDKADWTDGPQEDWDGPTDDAELLQSFLRNEKLTPTNRQLWEGDQVALTAWRPEPGRKDGLTFDATAVDFEISKRLMFQDGNDCERTLRLMNMSPYAELRQDKWNEGRVSVLRRETIRKAFQENVYKKNYAAQKAFGKSAASSGAQASPDGVRERGDRFMNPGEQLGHFAGCVYIQSQHRVFVPSGEILKPEVFKVAYGGFTFLIDNANVKITRDAFEAFTQSQCNEPAIAFGTCFKPLLPPGKIIERNGQRFVNTYVPVKVDRKKGDPAPILDLLAKLLPDQRDRTILLSYMAAVVQHAGVKFQWAPLIQGIEGNGKSMLSSCVEQAVGHRYTHWPKAKELGNKFNDWLQGKVFYAVEDIYVPDSKNEIMEDLKPMITGMRIEIQKKGVDQFSADICGNFIFNSNFQDAIRISDKSRRFCIFFTSQQTEEDLIRDGMKHTDYFPKLWKWLRDEGGYAIMNEYLHTYQIPAEFNPAGDCFRAPETSTTHLAIAASLGSVEQDILEAIEEGRQGFCGGWISSHWVKLLPKAERLGPKKRREIIEGMGYMPHPHLKEGRVNHIVTPDNAKPILYIRRGDALLAQITNQSAIAKSYEDANRFVTGLPFTQSYAK